MPDAALGAERDQKMTKCRFCPGGGPRLVGVMIEFL